MKQTITVLAALALIATTVHAFDVKTEDKQAFPTFKVTGWVKVTYQDTVYRDTTVTYASGFDIKDAALVVGGDAWANTSYRIYLQGNRKNKVTDKNDAFVSPTQAAYTPRLVEAYVDWKASPLYSFRTGQYKKPMSQDNLVAATNMDFISSSQIVAKFLDNNYDEGLMGYGKWRDLSYWLSLANGAPYNYKDKNWAKDVIARVTYLAIPGLTVGASTEYGTSDGAGKPLYRRRGGLEVNYEWQKLFVRAEWMIGRDDKTIADSLRGTRTRTQDTSLTYVWNATDSAYDIRMTFRPDTVYKWSAPNRIDQKVMRGGYLSVGYVVLPKLRVLGRVDLYRESAWLAYQKVGVNKYSPRSEIRNLNWTLGADYFLNPNTKITINYDIRQEDMAQPLIKNNVISLQAQVKF